jgi:YMGG-like Gly-zipper
MKIILTSAAAVLAAITLSNCSGPTGPDTQRGAVVGGLLGAGAGAIIGNQSGHAGEGALIGAGAGALGGAAIGNARDTERRNYNGNGNQGGYYDKYGNYHRNGY